MRFLSPAVLIGVCLHGGLLAQSSLAVSTEAIWHDNVTNAERPQDLLSALQWRSDLGAAFHRSLAGGHRLVLSTGLRADIWPQYEGLNAIAPGFTGTWEFKPGLGPLVPVLALAVNGEWSLATETARTGRGGAVNLQLRQRVGTDWLLRAGWERSRFDARGHAFDLTAREWSGRIEWSRLANWRVAVEGRWRQGTVVSYSRPPRPDLELLGKKLTLVDTFEQAEPWLIYYFPARTRSAALELERDFDRSAVVVRYEVRETLHAGPGYHNQRMTLRYRRTF
jgi:hypothetical protein